MGCEPEKYCEIADVESGKLVYTFGFPIVFIGLVLNVITIIVIWKQKIIRNHALVPLIFFMTLNDLFMCVYGIPVKALQKYLTDWPFAKDGDFDDNIDDNNLICKLTLPPMFLPWFLSMILPSLMSVSRGLSLLYGKDFASRKFNWKNTCIIFFCVSTAIFFFQACLCNMYKNTVRFLIRCLFDF